MLDSALPFVVAMCALALHVFGLPIGVDMFIIILKRSDISRRVLAVFLPMMWKCQSSRQYYHFHPIQRRLIISDLILHAPHRKGLVKSISKGLRALYIPLPLKCGHKKPGKSNMCLQ